MHAPTFAQEFLEAVFPERCVVCGVGVSLPGPCARHRLESTETAPRCGRCAGRLGRGLPDGYRCDACFRCPPAFVRALVLGDYGPDSPLRDWVLAFKHGGRADLAGPLGAALALVLSTSEPEGPVRPAPVLVPVPLHGLRRLERGYDQALLLARSAGRAGAWSVQGALRRRRWTQPQGSVGTGSRRANVAGVFRARKRAALAGRDVWLVDDVLTSGATVSECARVLRRAGAARVGVLAVARALGACL
jgi:ComF family protein